MNNSIESRPGEEVAPSEVGSWQSYEGLGADARKELKQVGFSSDYGKFHQGDIVKLLRPDGKVEDGWKFQRLEKEVGKDGVIRERIIVTGVENGSLVKESVSPSDFERVQELSSDWVSFDVQEEKKEGDLRQLKALRAEILQGSNSPEGDQAQSDEDIPRQNHNVMGVPEEVIANNRARAKESAQSDIEEHPVKIDEAQSFEELYSILDQMDGIDGSQGHYSAEEAKGIIDGVRDGRLGLDKVTSTAGLRETVARLTRAQANENIPRQNHNVVEISEKTVENSRRGAIESPQSVEQMKALVESNGYLFGGADASHRLAASIGELQELSKNMKVNSHEWSQTWDETFDQYPQSKEMNALKGTLAGLFTEEYKKSHSIGSRVKDLFKRAA